MFLRSLQSSGVLHLFKGIVASPCIGVGGAGGRDSCCCIRKLALKLRYDLLEFVSADLVVHAHGVCVV